MTADQPGTPAPDGTDDPYAGWTPEQLTDASIAELAAGRLPLQAQRRLAMMRTDQAFTSTLTVAEHHAIRSVGFTPVGQVLGSCVYQIGWTGMWNCGYGYGYRQPGLGLGTYSTVAVAAPVVDAPVLRQAMLDARHRAMDRMRQECAGLGGDGVVAVRLTVGPFSAGGLEFQAIGTAVRADGRVRPRQPFLSDLSGQEFALLLGAGWVPCALVLGMAVGVRHDDWRTVAQGSRWAGNTELTGITELVHTVRGRARDALRADCVRYGGTAAVVREMSLRVNERACSYGGEAHDHVAEATIIGTALVPFGRRDRAGQPARPVPPVPPVRPVIHL